jgi:hypothetical protein
MPGYKRDIVMRIVPENGAESVHWFTDRLTDLGAHVSCTPGYPIEARTRRDLNRVLRRRVYARRATAQIDVLIATMADQWFLQEIEEALDGKGYSVFLSLDGGVVEREVIRNGDTGLAPNPLKGKTVVGATFSLSLITNGDIGRRGPMMTDPGVGQELVQDGGLEAWPTQSWEAVPTLVMTQETTIVSGGVSSAKVARVDAAFNDFRPTNAASFSLRSGVWYRYRAMVRGSVAMTNAFQLRISNSTQAKEVAPDGKTWGASGTLFLTSSVTTSYALMEGYFRRYPQDPGTDKYRPRHVGLWTSGESLYYDDISVYGPVLRPGYATW